MAGAVLGGIGLGLVWGSLLAMLAWPERREPGRTLVGLGSASVLLVVAIHAIVGSPGAVALGIAASAALAVGLAWRAARLRQVGTEG